MNILRGFFFAAFCTTLVSASPITIVTENHQTYISYGTGYLLQKSETPVIESIKEVSSSIPGQYSTIKITNNQDDEFFNTDITFNLGISSNDKYSQASSSYRFNANENAFYSINGMLTLSGSPQYCMLYGTILDATTGYTVLFGSDQRSSNIPELKLTMGEENGNQYNYLFGSPQGQLIAGHQYILNFSTNVMSFNTSENCTGALVNGQFNLNVSKNVPEPGTLTLLVLSAVFTGIAFRRRKFH